LIEACQVLAKARADDRQKKADPSVGRPFFAPKKTVIGPVNTGLPKTDP